MSTPRRPRGDTLSSDSSSAHAGGANHQPDAPTSPYPSAAGEKPVYATFSPATLASASSKPVSAAKRLSTILVHQKSPLLLATPPQVTRALAYSHPFLLPLNKLVGLLTWTTGDPWESFLLVGLYWAVVLYGGVLIRFAGPLVLVVLLIGGMYGRRFSPLSSSGWSEDGGAGGAAAGPATGAGKQGKVKNNNANLDGGNKAAAGEPSSSSPAKAGGSSSGAGSGGSGGGQHNRAGSEVTNTKHQKTLDEIVETLKELTARCNILLEPLLELTDFLSTQRTATSATTRPALTRLLMRILMCTPVWVALTLPPLHLVTTRRVMLCFGTVVLTWHARVVTAGRTILWRSASVRRLVSLITGLDISVPVAKTAAAGAAKKTAAQEALEKTQHKMGSAKFAARAASSSRESELTKAIRRARGATDTGVRFTFIIYENQRRWVGLGWTNSLFAYERAAWTDEHHNAVPPREKFELPEAEDGSNMRWRWVEGSRWRVDGVPDDSVVGGDGDKWDYDGEGGKNGWVYYDNKWQNGRRGQDGWGRWTRRRKWYRDAELVEVDSDDDEDDDDDGQTPTKSKSDVVSDEPAPSALETPTSSYERAPSLPPRPSLPTLAPPFTTTSESLPMADTMTLQEIKEEDGDPTDEKTDDVASILSTSSRSTTGRFRMPSLRRRVTDNSNKQQTSTTLPTDRESITSSPRSVSGGVGRRSRRTSEAQSEDEAASLERLGVKRTPSDSWGVGDEVVMGLD
ncbi:unnamed protein product [Discula destructiva]